MRRSSTLDLDGEGDLETILVIEAVKNRDSARWMFYCMPVAINHQVVKHRETTVWERQRIRFSEATVPTATYFIFTRPARPEEVAESSPGRN
jgi:hypothetical protein